MVLSPFVLPTMLYCRDTVSDEDPIAYGLDATSRFVLPVVRLAMAEDACA